MTMSDDRPSRDHILMESARLWAQRSTCSRAQVGAVVATRDSRYLISGYNGAPTGVEHCNHDCICVRVGYDDLLVKGHHLSLCPSTKPCAISAHAEANAVSFAARAGVSLYDSQIFTTVAPCLTCSMLIINTGIYRVVYLQPHRDMSGVSLMNYTGLEVIRYEHGS